MVPLKQNEWSLIRSLGYTVFDIEYLKTAPFSATVSLLLHTELEWRQKVGGPVKHKPQVFVVLSTC